MTNPFASAWRSFWHTMTSNDRHASHDSPYRTGQHMPVNQNRHAPLTSIATSAVDSHPDLSSSYHDELKQPSMSSTQLGGSPTLGQSPSRPYAPGMRSSMSSPKRPNINIDDSSAASEIPMHSFADGAPPPPPVTHSWKKIDRWTESHYEELYDQLGEGCTQNDINELEHELDMSLPQDVRESLSIHDGQERGGRPTGIIFGCMLLDCEEIVQEWKNWKTVNSEYLSNQKRPEVQYPIKGLNSGSSSNHNQSAQGKLWRQELLDRQESQPPQAIQKAYAHPSWISLARDWGGNNIAVDLAPGPNGKWGQVILFGRDYDCKYVIAKSWANFLAIVADDISSEKVYTDEESGELKLREFKTDSVEPGYMDILRWRADQRHGRKGQKRKPQPPPGLNTNVGGQNGRSPYGSPTASNEDRGRSQQRFSRGANGSPRHAVGSPLARVQEELNHPMPLRTGGDVVKDFALDDHPKARRAEKLVDAPTPVEAKAVGNNKLVDLPTPIAVKGEKKDFPASTLSRSTTRDQMDEDEDKENVNEAARVKGLGLEVNGIEDEMKNVQI